MLKTPPRRSGRRSLSGIFTPLFLLSVYGGNSLEAQSTDISIGNTALQQSVNRMGINLGQMEQYGSQQIYKNLFATNPGFNDTQYQSVLFCSHATTSTVCDAGTYTYLPSGFWPTDGSVSVRVLTGPAAGCTTTLKSWSGTQYGFSSPCGISYGDYIALKKVITPGVPGFDPAYGWTTGGSSASTFAISTDAPPAANGTTYTQSLLITTPTSNDFANLGASADTAFLPWTGATRSFINLNGSYTVSYWAKAVSGVNAKVSVSLLRGGTAYLNSVQDSLSSSWTQYSHTFTAAEIGPQTNALNLNFVVPGGESVLMAKVNVSEATTSGNPTVFRDAVVSTLQALKPGVLRMSDQVGMTNTLDNMLVDQWARKPVDFSTVPLNGAPGYYNSITYSIPEFLQLCQTVGADAWITLPVTLSPAEVNELIDYLGGPATTTGGAIRVAQGFATPWTSVLKKIHLELGNEEWNGGTFDGASMDINFATYGGYAQSLFSVMKSNPNYNSSVISLVLNAQFVNSYLLQIVQNACNNNDEIDIAPYTAATLTDNSSKANIWQPGLAEPQVFWQPGTSSGSSMVCAEYVSGVLCPSVGYFNYGGSGQSVYGGGMYLAALAEANSTHPVAISIYEENNSATQGTFTQTDLNNYSSAWGAGLEVASEFLTNMQHGILTQNLYQLTGFYTTPIPNPNAAGASYVLLWGSVIDMGGPTNLRRPQFLAEQVINSGITPGASMLATKQTGTPTFSVGNPAAYPAANSTVNTVAAASVNTIQSFAFNNGSGNYSLILLNLDVANSHAVTFSGANAPAGSVTVTTLTSADLSDTNETSSVIAPATSTLSSPSGMTLAPYSMYLLTWNASATVPPPVISQVSATGITTTSATITWTTDEPSSSLVNYGTSTSYGLSSGVNSALVTSHSVVLTGLTPGTVYNFDVVSANSSNGSSTSGNATFTTTAATSGNAPEVGYVAYWGVTSSGATVSWSTNMPATTQLAYGTTPALGLLSPLQTTLASTHGVVLTGLTSGTTYYFVAQSTAGGATGYSSTYSFTTGGSAPGNTGGIPPTVSYVNFWGITSSGITIAWSSSDPATTQLAYGTTPALGQLTPLQSALTSTHGVVLTGLSSHTTYYFVAQSTDANNLTGYSTVYSFTTN